MRARRIVISVRPPATVRLSVPYNVALCDAMRFVDEKHEWIEKQLKRLRERGATNTIEMPFDTRMHSLKFAPTDTQQIKAEVRNGEILISYPMAIHYRSDEVQEFTKRAIEVAWKIEAEAILPKRLETLARQLGFQYGKLTIKNTRSKWGSCSSRNDIQLSVQLMRLPDHLIDYVIIHELCHIKHKNHGERFHALLSSLTEGRHLSLRRELKGYHTRW